MLFKSKKIYKLFSYFLNGKPCQKIQYYWRKRMLIKKTMYDILEELYERQQRDLKVFMLIDVFFDENLDNIIYLYNKKDKRLSLMSYESFCIISEVPLD